jgi:hypothetical protein
MVDAVCGHRRAALRLGQDKGALKYSLSVERETRGAPVGFEAITLQSLGDVGLDLRRVGASRTVDGRADLRVGLIGFLHHRADQAGELENRPGENRFAKIDVAEHSVERIVETKLFRRAAEFITGERRGEAMRHQFRLFVLNCAVRNGDAHLKNFGVVYDDTRSDARPAPAYDIVTTSAYLPKDQMALTLNGVPTWPDAKKLTHLGQTRAGLTGPQVKQIFEATADALADVAF